jgi:hypothetical protein
LSKGKGFANRDKFSHEEIKVLPKNKIKPIKDNFFANK